MKYVHASWLESPKLWQVHDVHKVSFGFIITILVTSVNLFSDILATFMVTEW
jgi:hypothetical protein